MCVYTHEYKHQCASTAKHAGQYAPKLHQLTTSSTHGKTSHYVLHVLVLLVLSSTHQSQPYTQHPEIGIQPTLNHSLSIMHKCQAVDVRCKRVHKIKQSIHTCMSHSILHIHIDPIDGSI